MESNEAFLPEAKIIPLPDHGPNRSVLLLDGKLARVVMATRPSTTAHGRIKVLLGAPVRAQLDGPSEEAFVVFSEFRLEMN